MPFLRRLSPYQPHLLAIAVVGFVFLNGPFLYFALVRPDVMAAAFANPISLVFIIEAFLLTGGLAGLIALLGVDAPGWRAFVVLSLVGSLAFSVPAFLLLHLRKQTPPQHEAEMS